MLQVLAFDPYFQFVSYKIDSEECHTQTRAEVDLRVRANLHPERSFYAPDGEKDKTRAGYSFYFQPDFTGLTNYLQPKTSLYISMHESGHTLGLADLYKGEENGKRNEQNDKGRPRSRKVYPSLYHRMYFHME